MQSNLKRVSETNREGLNVDKIQHTARVLWHGQRADANLDSFLDFFPSILRQATGKKLLSILLDVDGCIAPPYGPIPPENIRKIRHLKEDKIGLGVYSNCKAMDRLSPLRGLGIPIYDGDHPKPSKQGFLEACNRFNFDPESTWMVGDNPLTDGGAVGVLEGMAYIKPIPVDPEFLETKKRLSLFFANLMRDTALTRVK